MRGNVLATAVVVMVACRRDEVAPPPPPPPAPPSSVASVEAERPLWSTTSPRGHAVMELRQHQAACTLSCRRDDGQQAWAATGCLATAHDFRFVSDDCHFALLLYPYPTKAGSWGEAVAVRLLEDGVVSRERKTRELPGVDTDAARFRWLAGALDEPGTPPHLSADGQFVEVELKTRAGRVPLRLPLGPDATPSAGPTLYRWTDERGEAHFAERLEGVPARFRQRSSPVSSSVGVVPTQRDRPTGAAVKRAVLATEPTDAGGGNSCERARRHLAFAEDQLESLRQLAANPPIPECNNIVMTPQGYDDCMDGGVGPPSDEVLASAQELVLDAQDQLRRAQMTGCK